MVFSNNLLMGAAGQSTGYEIDQSVRFNDLDSAFLARTPDASNRKTWTWSAWVKRANLFNGSVPQILLSAGDGGNNDFVVQFGQTNDTLRISDYIGGTASNLIPTQLFRDVGAWYHFVLAYDTTQGTAANRIKLYLNGSQVTAFGTEVYPSQNTDMVINSAIPHNIGRGAYSSNGYFSGYMAEINFVDGTALAPTAFGETNDDGVWVPIAYAGAYGTEGYLIDGRDSSDLGDDESGNGNDYASSGLTAADQMPDTPTLNHWTLNPLDSGSTLANGNLQNKGGSSTNTHAPAFPKTGKWYVEIDCIDINTGTGGAHFFAICDASIPYSANFATHAATSAGQERGGQLQKNNSNTSSGTAVNDGDVIALAFDADNLTLDLYVNNSASGSQITGLTDVQYKLWVQDGGTVTNMQFNFAEASLEYTPPSGYKALNTSNLATPTIKDGSEYFQTALYTGRTTAFDVTFDGNSDLAPDWLWFKARSASSNHFLFDKIRGALKTISSDDATPEESSTGSMTAFGTDGFSLGDGGSANDINGVAGTTYAAWGWAANGSGSSNSDGSVTSTVSANTTAGFSITKYTGTGSNATVGHGLGAVPKTILIKDTTNTESWIVYHEGLGNDGNVYLNLASAKVTQAIFQDTTPTSSVFSLGTGDGANKASGVHIAYCFAEIPGYSSIGSFIGNGSTDGPFMFTGFKPAFIIFKNSGNANNWDMMDTQRSPINPVDQDLQPSTSSAESTPGNQIDYLSNGFKLRTTTANLNNNGNTIIYIAFAENPFGGDGVAPATAR